MQVMINMMKDIFSMKFPWNVWVNVMVLVNLAGLYYIRLLEGLLAIAAMLLASMIMLLIYRHKGFVRLMGLGHIIAWTPLVSFFIWRLYQGHAPQDLTLWMIAVISINSLSLLIDYIDVFRYYRGDRQPL